MNPYEVLEISPGASLEEIKAAYHGMAKKWHPDRYVGAAKAEAEQRFRMLAEAYNMIKDTPQREDRPTAGEAPSSPVPVAGPGPVPLELDLEPRPAAVKAAEDWFRDAKVAAESDSLEKALGLVQYAIRMDPERAEFHALYARLLDATNGDRRTLVRTLETALRLNPKDVHSTILLAQTFESLGMPARAGRLWTNAAQLAPNHPLVVGPGTRIPGGKGLGGGGKAAGLQNAWANLVDGVRSAVDRILKRG